MSLASTVHLLFRNVLCGGAPVTVVVPISVDRSNDVTLSTVGELSLSRDVEAISTMLFVTHKDKDSYHCVYFTH
jgi:hypothetical protein